MATWGEWVSENVEHVTKQVNGYFAPNEEEEVDDALERYYQEKHGHVPDFAKKKVTNDELQSSNSSSRSSRKRRNKGERSGRSKTSRNHKGHTTDSIRKHKERQRERSSSRSRNLEKKRDGSSTNANMRRERKTNQPYRSADPSPRMSSRQPKVIPKKKPNIFLRLFCCQ
eukprot:NODE_21_length_42443_cov_0.822808.p31 type:complete len:170 gc:universal NODE_21_length_42443_cov_0.822808:9556-9047(-)